MKNSSAAGRNERNEPIIMPGSELAWEVHPNAEFEGVRVAFPGPFARLLRVTPGGVIARHVHPDAWDFSYVVQGRGQARIEPDRTLDVSVGDYFGVPPGRGHSVRNTGSDVLLILLHRIQPTD